MYTLSPRPGACWAPARLSQAAACAAPAPMQRCRQPLRPFGKAVLVLGPPGAQRGLEPGSERRLRHNAATLMLGRICCYVHQVL